MPRYDQPSPLLLHLQQAITFNSAEEEALRSLERETVQVCKHTALLQEGEPHDRGYVVKSGWLARHHSLSDGRDQILDFVIPGDLPGLEGSVLDTADHSVTALEDATVAPFSFAMLQQLVSQHPRLATAMIWSEANDKAALGKRLTSLGRRTAYEAAAHLIFMTWRRMSTLGLVSGSKSFRMPITQMEFADALGLSAIHMNRVLQRLDRDGVATKDRTEMTIHDIERLSEIAS